MPALIPSLSDLGIELINHSRIGSKLMMINSMPEMNAAPSATCQRLPMPMQMPNAKNAFWPIPGARAIG